MRSRRRFLGDAAKSSAMLAALPGAGTMLVGARRADDPQPHFFVFVQIYGAWDVCLAFDPKNRDARLADGQIAFDQPYAIDDVRSYGNIRLAPHGLPLAPFADRMTIVNGIDMELDNGHSPIIVMTGEASVASQKPFLQALISDRHPYVRQCLIPHLYASYDGYFNGGTLSAKTVTIARADAHRILFSAGGSGSLLKSDRLTRLAAASYDPSARQKIGQYTRALSQAASVRDTLGQGGTTVDAPVTAEQFGNFSAILFKTGVLGSLTWSLGEAYQFDTHQNHYQDHPLRAALDDIAAFTTRLGEVALDDHTSVLDRTTIVVTGEFARTPRLNSSRGKDHNIKTNSLVLIGHNVRAGVFGESGERHADGGAIDAHAGLPVSLETGRPAADGDVLKMRNVWAGSGNILGVDLSREFGADTRPVQFLRV